MALVLAVAIGIAAAWMAFAYLVTWVAGDYRPKSKRPVFGLIAAGVALAAWVYAADLSGYGLIPDFPQCGAGPTTYDC